MIEKVKTYLIVILAVLAVASLAIAGYLLAKPPVSNQYITPTATATAQANTFIFSIDAYKGKAITYQTKVMTLDEYAAFRATIPVYLQFLVQPMVYQTWPYLFASNRKVLVSYPVLEPDNVH